MLQAAVEIPLLHLGDATAEAVGRAGLTKVGLPAFSTLTRERFAWQPTHPSLLDDPKAGNYMT